MEAARHKLIEFYDNQEEKKKIERYEGAKVICQQIAVCYLNELYNKKNIKDNSIAFVQLKRMCKDQIL